VEGLEEALEKERSDRARAPRAPAAPPLAGGETADEGEGAAGVTPFWARSSIETPRELRGVYDKPFLATLWRRAHVGGYTELEYHDFEDDFLEIPEGFRMHRTNLFLFTEVSDRIRFGSELEFETEFEDGQASSDIETKVEMAFVDWVLWNELKFRGGAILAPLGRINVNHDGPVRELTERPLVSTYVIPTTLTEAGAGVHGTVPIAADWSLSYEAYAVNGFSLLDADGELSVEPIDTGKILQEGRDTLGGDVNDGVATTGRLGIQALGKIDAGASWHVGAYDERGDNDLLILAGDFALVEPLGAAELGLEGEIAVADFARDSFARTAGVPDTFWGYYVQVSAGTMPEILRNAAPHVFGDEGALFTVVFRYEHVDLDGDRGEVLEPGLSFRPVADTVFKFSYRFAPRSLGPRGLPGQESFDDEGFVVSLSSYF
jgi:hypothetical protein